MTLRSHINAGNDITEMCQNYLSPLLSIYRLLMLIVTFSISLIIFVNLYVDAVILMFSTVVVFVSNLTALGACGAEVLIWPQKLIDKQGLEW